MKYASILLALLLSVGLSAQVSQFDKVTIKTGGTLKINPGAALYLNNYGVTGISNDSTDGSSSSVKLITEAGAKGYANTKGRVDSLSLLQDSILVAYDVDGNELFRDTIAGTGGGDPIMGGDISGTASNAQIVAGAVGATELATGAVVLSSGDVTGTLPIANGGTGLASYTAGDMLYYSTGTNFTKLGIGTANQLLRTNSGGTAPEWFTPSYLTSEVDGSTTNEIQNVSYTAATRAVAISGGGTGFTFPLFSSTDAGLAPASGGGTSNFLRADGTWAAPSGGISGSGTSGQVPVWNGPSSITGFSSFTATSSAVLFPDGTASLPGVSFVNDSDVGLWRPSANILALSTAGVERVRIGADTKITDNQAYATTTNSFVINQPNSFTSFNGGDVFKIRSNSSIKISDRYNETKSDVGVHINYFGDGSPVNMFIGRDYSNAPTGTVGLLVTDNITGTHNYSGALSSAVVSGTTNDNNNIKSGISVVSRYSSENYTSASTSITYGIHAVSSTSTGLNTAGATKRHVGGYFEGSPSWAISNTNNIAIGVWAKATGGEFNYAGIFESGNVGIGNTAPTEPLDVTGNVKISGVIKNADGTAAAPAYTFTNDPNTGIYSTAADEIAFATNGTSRFRINTQLNANDGSAAAPAYTFLNDTDCGIYRIGANTIGWSAGGTERMRLGTTGLSIGTTATTYTANVGGSFNAFAAVIAPNGAGNAGWVLENSGDANNSWMGYRADNGDFVVAHSTAQPFSSETRILEAQAEKINFKTNVIRLENISGPTADGLTAQNGDLVYIGTIGGSFTSVGFWGYINGTWTKL